MNAVTVTPAAVLVGNKKIIDLPEQTSPPASWLLFTGDPADGKLYKTQRQNLGFLDSSTLGIPGGIATLDANSKLKSSQIPAIAITDTYVVESEAEMLALEAETGDVAIRNDNGLAYILQNNPASELDNWVKLATPGQLSVTSVNGMTGNVILAAGDGLSYDNVLGLFRLGKLATDTASTQGTVYNDTDLILDGNKQFSIKSKDDSAQLYIKGGVFEQGAPVVFGMKATGFIGVNPDYSVSLEGGVNSSFGPYLQTSLQSAGTSFYNQLINSGQMFTTYNFHITWNDTSGDKRIRLQRASVDGLVYENGMLAFGDPYSFNSAFINARVTTGIDAFIHYTNADNSEIMHMDASMCTISNLKMVFASSTIEATGDNNYFTKRTMFGHSGPSPLPLTLVQMGTTPHGTNSMVTICNMGDTVDRFIIANLYVDRRITATDSQTVNSPTSSINYGIVFAGTSGSSMTVNMTATYDGSILAGSFIGGFENDDANNCFFRCGSSANNSTSVIACIARIKTTQLTSVNGWMTGVRSTFVYDVSATTSIETFADLAVGFSQGTAPNISSRYGLYIADMGPEGTRFGIYQAGINEYNIFNGRVNIGNETKIYTAEIFADSTTAVLELASSIKGFLPPRMTKAQRNAIAAPSIGLTIYQTDATAGQRVYNGTSWVRYTETAD